MRIFIFTGVDKMASIMNCIRQELEHLIRLSEILNKDATVPKKGAVVVKRFHNKHYYYQVISSHNSHRHIYLGNDASQKLKSLARSLYKKELMKAVKHNIRVLSKAIEDYQPCDKHSILSKLSPCLFNLQFDADFDVAVKEMRKWAKADYSKNPMPFKGGPITAQDGTRVRSRAECNIYNALLDAGIPFRYDPVLVFRKKVGNNQFERMYESPDFQILCPDGSFILIEHAGLLSSDQYAIDLARKLQLYQLNGYVLGYTLFVTSDNVDGGIDSREIRQIIDLIMDRYRYY